MLSLEQPELSLDEGVVAQPPPRFERLPKQAGKAAKRGRTGR